MNLLDLYEQREPYQQAIDKLEQRRIDDLHSRMDDLVARAKQATDPAHKASLVKEFQKYKAERDSYYSIREGSVTRTATGLRYQADPGRYGGYEPEPELKGLNKTLTKNLEKGMGIEFKKGGQHNRVQPDMEENGIPGNVPTEKIPGKEDLLKGRGRTYYEDQKKNSESVDEHGGGIGPSQRWQDLMPEQKNPEDDDWYDDEEETDLRSGDYVRDTQDGEHGEIFRMQGDPYERRVRILDRDGRGWYIEPSRLTRVDPTDPDVQRYFGKHRQRDMDEAISKKDLLGRLQKDLPKVTDPKNKNARPVAWTGPGKDDYGYTGYQGHGMPTDRQERDRVRADKKKGVAEEQKPAGWGEFPPKQEITIVPPKKLKSGETYQDQNKYWQSQGQAPIYKTNEDNDPRVGMARIYHQLAPKIERYKDSFLAGQLYDELENYAELHGAEKEFKQMMNGARNRAHMEYDTNPGGFHNWFWFLPFEDESVDEGWSDAYVSRRTGSPRTPYSVYIKGKKWKDFANDDLARAVMDRLKAKFKAEGRDPSVITIAPTDMTEEALVEGIRDTASATAVIACLLVGGGLTGCATAPQQTTAQQVLKTGQNIGGAVIAAKRITQAGAEEEVRQELRNLARGMGGQSAELNNSNILRIWRKIKGADDSQVVNEIKDTEAVEQAILKRIMVAHLDLLKQYGPEKIMNAAEDVAYNVGNVDEIGTSDVSAYVNQVRQILGAVA